MSTFRSDRGFTLLEVLIAIAIFAVASIVSLQAYLSSLRHIQIITEEKNIILLSRLKIEELKAEKSREEREQSGKFNEPFEQYEWSLELSDSSVRDTEYGITFTPYRLTVGSGNLRFSTLTPFLSIIKEETAERIE